MKNEQKLKEIKKMRSEKKDRAKLREIKRN